MSVEEVAVCRKLALELCLLSRVSNLAIEKAVSLGLGQVKDFKLSEIIFNDFTAAAVHQVIELVFEILDGNILIPALLKQLGDVKGIIGGALLLLFNCFSFLLVSVNRLEMHLRPQKCLQLQFLG